MDPENPQHAAALHKALKRLKRSDAFESEIRTLLLTSGFESDTAEQVVRHLRGKGILNDARTVRGFISAKIRRKAAGVEKLRTQLLAKGAPEELVEQELAQISPEEQRAAIRELLTKRKLDRAQAGRFLFGRGFSEEEIEDALREFYNELN